MSTRLAILQAVMEEAPDKTGFLCPLMAGVLASDESLVSMGSSIGIGIGTFDDPVWKLWKATWGVKWDTLGTFVGGPPKLEILGPQKYVFRANAGQRFGFQRGGADQCDEVVPGTMITDGGSIPRIAWSIPGLDPWTYIWAYLLHDWMFMAHHCVPDAGYNFAEANDTLAEAIYTLMMTGQVPQDWRTVAIIHAGCSSWVGKAVWNRAWTPDECQVELNP